MRTLGRAIAAGIVLSLSLTACSSGKDGPDAPGAGDGRTSEKPHEPTLAERFYPEAEVERVRIGNEDYADPCHVLPPADVIRLFDVTPLDGIAQTTTMGSASLDAGPEADCRYPLQGYALSAAPEETRRWAAYNARFRAISIGDGIWFSGDRPGAFDGTVEELRGSAAPTAAGGRPPPGSATGPSSTPGSGSTSSS